MILSIVLLCVLVLAVDALLIFTPWFMPDSECMTVTVPHGARDKEPLKGIMRAYALRSAIACAVCAIAAIAGFLLLDIDFSTEQGAGMFAFLYTFAMCAPLVVSFMLMLHYRRQVQDIKREQGWRAEHVRAVAFVGSDEDFPRPISVFWNLLYIPLIAGMVAFALLNYDRFPDMIPMNMDINGTVATYVPKSLGSVLFPAYVSSFMGIVFAFTHIGVVRSKKPIDPDAPASSALAYGNFARVQSIFLLAGGLALSAVIGATFYASSLEVISMNAAVGIMMAVAFAIVAAVLVISVKMGQSGARISAEAPEGSMARDDDELWKLGTFYCNREDPSIFVPKRFGVGWTINIANPWTWLVVAVFIAVTVLFVWGSYKIAG